MGRCGAIESFVLVEDLQRFGEHSVEAAVQLFERARHPPAEVDSGRSRLGDSLGRRLDVASFAGREHDAKRTSRAQRGRAAHRKAADRVDQLVDGAQY